MNREAGSAMSEEEVSPDTYWRRLKRHPGVPLATFLTIMGFFAGGADSEARWIGAAMFSIFWIPVLITARTQP